MHSPLIKDLERALTALLPVTAQLKTSPQRTAIVSLLRKLRIARELSSAYYVCVAGSQSAGKTRLVRELYGLDDSWLADNQGRGERIPVFIFEKAGCTAPYAVAIQCNDSDEEQEIPLSPEEFRALVSDYDAGSDKLFPKIYVPQRHFAAQQFGFVLLPGYEVVNRDNAQWQGLMRHTLIHSLGSVLVTDRTRVADHSQQQILQDLVSRYFPDRKPILAVTKTELFNEGQLRELCATVADVFSVPGVEQDRIVCTGVGDETYRSKWCEEIIRSINKYSLSSVGADEIRLQALEELVIGDLNVIREGLENEEGFKSITNHLAERNVEKFKELFSKAVVKYRKGYSKKLSEQVWAHAGIAKGNAGLRYEKEEENFAAKFKQAVNFLSLQSGEQERVFKERILDCWRESDANLVPRLKDTSLVIDRRTPLDSDYVAISQMSQSALGVSAVTDSGFLHQLKQGSLENLLGYDHAATPNVQMSNEALKHDLQLLLGTPRESDKLKPSQLENGNAEEVLKLLPAMTMEYLRLNQAIALRTPELANSDIASFDFDKLAKEIKEQLPAASSALKPLINSIGAILAVDVMIDGTVDTIPAVIDTVTGGTAATGLGASLSMAAAGAIALGFMAYKGANEVQRYDAARKGMIIQSIDQFAESHIQKSLDVYDELMDNLEDRLVGNLRLAYGLGNDLSIKDAMARQLNRLDRARINLVRAIDDVQRKRVV